MVFFPNAKRLEVVGDYFLSILVKIVHWESVLDTLEMLLYCYIMLSYLLLLSKRRGIVAKFILETPFFLLS